MFFFWCDPILCIAKVERISSGMQEILVVDKDASGAVKQKSIMSVNYVPLTEKEAQWSPAASRSEL